MYKSLNIPFCIRIAVKLEKKGLYILVRMANTVAKDCWNFNDLWQVKRYNYKLNREGVSQQADEDF